MPGTETLSISDLKDKIPNATLSELKLIVARLEEDKECYGRKDRVQLCILLSQRLIEISKSVRHI
jgi:hypothetical protein